MTSSLPHLQSSRSKIRAESVFGPPVLWRVFFTIFAIVLVYFLWLQNFGRVHIYDYSLVSYANAYLQRGMQPYRDFGTPLQTLTYYLAYLSEGIFGRRYLALGYSNLVLTYFLFGSLLILARRTLPYLGAVLVSFCICIATTLQGGIFWYNQLGILLLVWVTICACGVIRNQRFTGGQLSLFAILFLATGTLKLNYHLANTAIFSFCLLWLLVSRAVSWRRFAVISLAAAVWAVVAPILWELLLTGASLSTWKLNVLVRPSGRAHQFLLLKSRDFWLGTARNFYPGDPFAGAFALGMICCVAATLLLLYREPRRSVNHRLIPAVFTIVGMWMFFGLSLFLAFTNVDLESTSASLLPIGLLGMSLAFRLKFASRRILAGFALVFAGWLGWQGLYGIHRHTRLLIPTQVLSYQDSYRVNEGYLKGALLSKLNAEQLSDAGKIVKQYRIAPGSNEIYWGPGTEMFARQFRTTPLSGFPLWYSPVTVREQDVAGILTHLETSPVRVFVADPFWYKTFVAASMKQWLSTHWTPERQGTLIEFVRPQRY